MPFKITQEHSLCGVSSVYSSSSNSDGEVVTDDDDEMWNLFAKKPKTYLTGR
jgi:hypothetical protein